MGEVWALSLCERRVKWENSRAEDAMGAASLYSSGELILYCLELDKLHAIGDAGFVFSPSRVSQLKFSMFTSMVSGISIHEAVSTNIH